MSNTPQQVEPGQVWRDNDERSRGSGEFVVEYVSEREGVALVRREATGRPTKIRVDRLLAGKAYRYIGRAR